jgi:hypothetical protein
VWQRALDELAGHEGFFDRIWVQPNLTGSIDKLLLCHRQRLYRRDQFLGQLYVA